MKNFFLTVGKQLFYLVSTREKEPRLSHNRIAFWILFGIFIFRYIRYGLSEINISIIMLLLIFAGYEISKLAILSFLNNNNNSRAKTSASQKLLLEEKTKSKKDA